MAYGPALILALSIVVSGEETPLRFQNDILPILANKCFTCHGPDADARQGDLRLDLAEALTVDRGGYQVVVPNQPEQSELLRRVKSADPEYRMPPPSERLQLTEEEKTRLERWIASGAATEQHWAFQLPRRPPLPDVQNKGWVRNPIDRFVLAKLEAQNIAPSPGADKPTLIRRLSLDLTGLPPSPEEVADFLEDDSPEAYEKLVDRLLSSPRYGERMTLDWLDAARFADSGGYQGDILRSMWLWRDWVIDAFNRNLPYDQFTIEQLAGDLLPNPTIPQQIATGFNRNHRINDEDGIIHEEFRVEYVADRLETTATVWLGLTIGCARCHDHKYDPITQREYYQLFAYFNSVDESGRGHGNAPPLLPVPSVEQAAAIEQVQASLKQRQEQLQAVGSDEPEENADKRKQLQAEIETLTKQLQQRQAAVPTVMVMKDLPEPRATYVLHRGAYDQPSEPVEAGTPAILSSTTERYPPDRLGLARWLFDPNNPLTARVTVNRYWQLFFGRGLVKTTEDFGVQGDFPTHPLLLDWLATEFVRTGWDLKRLHRWIVTSAAYRQASNGSEALLQLDPSNALLARGPRYRLSAEMIRDQALAVSGLLVERLGGPSVRPYQPPKLWKELASNSENYNQGSGADLYRRSMYTFVRRTIPPPAMAAFDAPNRELCTVRRPRTNTPLQALNLMNDPIYVEAARALAQRTLRGSRDDDAERLRRAFVTVLSRTPSREELAVLERSLAYYRRRFADDHDAAAAYLSVGESVVDEQSNAPELAAFTSVCSILLNLDETITRE